MFEIIDFETDLSFYDSVRRILGGLGEESLSDEAIQDPMFKDIAEIELLKIVPCIDDMCLTESQKKLLRLAYIYLIASLISPTLYGIVEYEVKTIDVTWKRKPVDYNDLADMLRARVDDLLGDFECYQGGESSVLFAIAPSKRASLPCNQAYREHTHDYTLPHKRQRHPHGRHRPPTHGRHPHDVERPPTQGRHPNECERPPVKGRHPNECE